MDNPEIICLYSNFSLHSKRLLNMIKNRLNFKLICIDNPEIINMITNM